VSTSIGVIEGPSFVEGETDTDRDYAIVRDRLPFDLTGYSDPQLYARNVRTGVALAAIPGSVLVPTTGGVIRFSHDALTAEDADEWIVQVELVHPVSGTRRLKRDMRIVVRPKVED
jgi:hypothetical protein